MFIFPIIGWSKAALMVQEVPAKGHFWKTWLQILFWFSMVFSPASTTWPLFCSGIKKMAFVLFRHQQQRRPFMKYISSKSRIFTRQSHISQVSTTLLTEWRSFLQGTAMIRHESDKKVLNRINNTCNVQNILHGTSLPEKCEEKEGRINILLVWKL